MCKLCGSGQDTGRLELPGGNTVLLALHTTVVGPRRVGSVGVVWPRAHVLSLPLNQATW